MKKFLFVIIALLISFPVHAAGIDSSTALMLHMDGADAATAFTDSSGTPKTVTAVGHSQIDTAQAKFAQAGLFDGTGDGLSLADSNDFAFSNGTLDFWVRFNTVASTVMLYQQNDGVNAVYFQYYQPNNTLNFQIYTSASLTTFLAPTWTPATNTWYHIALVKNGSAYTTYVNGTSIGTATGGGWPNVAAPVYVGADNTGAKSLNGWFDEYRISKTARWTANFTPPVEAYSAPIPPPPPEVGESEQAYWKDRAALLEPDAYIYLSGVFNYVATEPSYLLNGWQLTEGGDNTKFWYHRKASTENALLLPTGTSVQHVGSPSGYNFDWGYALIAKPSLVTDDPRYENARDLYYQRLEKLKTLPLRSLKVKITQTHTAIQAQNAGTLVASFPTDFENGLLVQFSNMDGSWMVLESDTTVTAPLSPSYRILNLADELDDVRSVRYTGAMMMPFKRSQFPTLRLGFGSAFINACTGVNTPATGCQGPTHPINAAYGPSATYPAYGQILYYNLDDLPEPW